MNNYGMNNYDPHPLPFEDYLKPYAEHDWMRQKIIQGLRVPEEYITGVKPRKPALAKRPREDQHG